MLTTFYLFPEQKHALLAFCILLGLSGAAITFAKESLARDGNAEDTVNKLDAKPAETDDGNIPKILRGRISIEESMRLRRDLDEYSRTVDPAHVQIEERRRLMHQRVQARFVAIDKDNDGKISRLEATESLPQVARHFSLVDTDNDGYITLEELENLQGRIAERQRAESFGLNLAPSADSDATKRKSKDAMLANRKRTL